jgi:hypothetical protein
MGAVTVDTSQLDQLIASMTAAEVEQIPKGRFRKGVTELNKEIVKTSPVDTGYYRAGWTLEFGPDGKEAVISNPVGYAEWLVFGRKAFGIDNAVNWDQIAKKSYPRADLSRGILHDVRAIYFEWKENFLTEAEDMRQV